MRKYCYVKNILGEPDTLRIATPDGGVITRAVDFDYDPKTPSAEQQATIEKFVTYHINSWIEQYQRVYQGESADSNIIHMDTYVGGHLKSRTYNDYNESSYKLKRKLADIFPEYYNKRFFPNSPPCFDIFKYDKLNKYEISEYVDGSKIELRYECITDHELSSGLPSLFAAFHTINFYTTFGINFTLIHDMDNKTKNIKWSVPSNLSINDHRQLPDIRDELVFASEREFNQQGQLIMSTVKVYADHDYINDLCVKLNKDNPLILHPFFHNRERKGEPWAYSISFNRDGIQEIAAHVNSYYK